MDKKTNKIVNKVVKEEIAKKLKELREDDYEDIPDEYKEFDPEEFEGSAKQAAKQDIEGSGEEFQDIGQSKYEKNVSAEDFLKDFKQANMRLPQDEKEIEKIQKALDKRKEQVASMKGASLNEKKRIKEQEEEDDNKKYYAIINRLGEVGKPLYFITNNKTKMVNKLNHYIETNFEEGQFEKYNIEDFEGDKKMDHFISDDWALVTDDENIFKDDFKLTQKHTGIKPQKI